MSRYGSWAMEQYSSRIQNLDKFGVDFVFNGEAMKVDVRYQLVMGCDISLQDFYEAAMGEHHVIHMNEADL